MLNLKKFLSNLKISHNYSDTSILSVNSSTIDAISYDTVLKVSYPFETIKALNAFGTIKDGKYCNEYDFIKIRNGIDVIENITYSSETNLKATLCLFIDNIPYSLAELTFIPLFCIPKLSVVLRITFEEIPAFFDNYSITKTCYTFNKRIIPILKSHTLRYENYFISKSEIYSKKDAIESNIYSKPAFIPLINMDTYLASKKILHMNKIITKSEAKKKLSKDIEIVSYPGELEFITSHYDDSSTIILHNIEIMDSDIISNLSFQSDTLHGYSEIIDNNNDVHKTIQYGIIKKIKKLQISVEFKGNVEKNQKYKILLTNYVVNDKIKKELDLAKINYG